MKKKLSIKLNHYIFILSLILISCVGVGFSSWITGPSNKDNANVDTNVGDVIDINNYIKYGTVEIFDYCKHGVINDETIVEKGDVIINFSIELSDSNDKILNHISSVNNDLTILTEFSNGSPNVSAIFSTYLQSVDLSVSALEYSNAFDIKPTKNEYDTSKTYNSSFSTNTNLEISKLFFRIKYSFKFPVYTDFNTYVFAKLNRGKFWFDFKAEVK